MNFKRCLSCLCLVALVLVMVPVCPAVSAATTTLFYENFENSSSLPSGFWAYDADGDGNNWIVDSDGWSGYPTSGNCLASNSHLNPGKLDEWLMMPAVELRGEEQADFELSFMMESSYMPGASDWMQVYVSETAITDPLVLTQDQLVSDILFYSGSSYEEFIVNLNAYRGKTVHIAFRHYNKSYTSTWQLYMDDILVRTSSPKTYPVKFPKETDVFTVTPTSGKTNAAVGFDYAFSVTANEPYVRPNGTFKVTVNGRELAAQDGVYTIANVQEKQDVDIVYSYDPGDLNGDLVVDMVDAMLLYRAASGASALDAAQYATALISPDDIVDIVDAMQLYAFAGGSRAYLNVNEKLSLLWSNSYVDPTGGFAHIGSVKKAAYYMNNRPIRDYAVDPSEGDSKLLFFSNSKTRAVNLADGYAITLPTKAVYADYSLSKYRSRYEMDDMILNVSAESKSPYGNRADGWNIYLTEWLNRFIANDSFLSRNNITRIRATEESTTKLSGYTVLNYDMYIQNDGDIAMPYYHVAVIRKTGEYVKFHLLVMKATSDSSAKMDAIVKSFKEITPKGAAVNTVSFERETPSYWNDETKAYYEKLCEQDATDWGFFSASMTYKSSSDYETQQDRIRKAYDKLSAAMEYDYEIMPTYTHIGWGNTQHAFPTDMAKEFAGGNGFNGKPVLQMSYQFTTSNNTALEGYTPVFDILRGEYDDLFRSFARDIKSYGKPVLFRLNNEMNTDWTSYCGIVSLLDPDIFVMTWERMYEIFMEEGVDNCIWIFNPMADTTPYCNWGEDLCYLPDMDYVQAIGLTSYEMGNESKLVSFEDRYRALYEKNTPHFADYPWIISEFGAGAGGEKIFDWGTNAWNTTTLGRNASAQEQWVKDMFECFSHRTERGYEFCDRIKGAVWFSCNDYVTLDNVNYVKNYFELDDGVSATVEAFRQGLAQ